MNTDRQKPRVATLSVASNTTLVVFKWAVGLAMLIARWGGKRNHLKPRGGQVCSPASAAIPLCEMGPGTITQGRPQS